jgi:hypothetical protein
VVQFQDGRIGIEVRDDGAGYLQTPNDIDPSRMTRDQPAFASVVGDQLRDLSDFVVRLITIAVDAALALRDESLAP